jgi:hypothetical protein
MFERLLDIVVLVRGPIHMEVPYPCVMSQVESEPTINIQPSQSSVGWAEPLTHMVVGEVWVR